eukprot:COSAG01_NODE_13357_length_1596_cov_4.113560_1_plen_39_part_10
MTLSRDDRKQGVDARAVLVVRVDVPLRVVRDARHLLQCL